MSIRKRAKLGNLVDTQKGYAFKSGWYQAAGRPIVKVSDFTRNSVNSSNLVCIPETIAAEYLKYELHHGDVVIQTVGSWPSNPASVVGKCVRVPKDAAGALLNQNAVKLSPYDSLDQRFLFYRLRTNDFKNYIVGTAQGAASQAAITLDAIRGYEFELPPLQTQKRIASILGDYDDLIEVNRRRIALLEEMSRRLYEEWFVHFRFPGYENHAMVKTPEGPLPEGWSRKELGDLCAEIRDTVSPADLDVNTPYVGLEHIPRRSITLDAWGRVDEVTSTKLRFRKGDVLFGKIRPYFHKVVFAPFDAVSSSDAIVIRSRALEWTGLVLNVTSSASFVAKAVATSNGTKMPRANWNVLARTSVPIAPDGLMKTFNEAVVAWVELAASLNSANIRLAASRDLLLPRIISGDLRVSTDESVLKAVA